MPAGPAGRVTEGSLRRRESIVRRTKGQGSMLDFCNLHANLNLCLSQMFCFEGSDVK